MRAKCIHDRGLNKAPHVTYVRDENRRVNQTASVVFLPLANSPPPFGR